MSPRRRPHTDGSGIDLYGDRLSRRVIAEIEAWRGDDELGKLVARLEAQRSRKSFLNTYAEVMVARHLLERGCALRLEVPTPAGRHSDFAVTLDGAEFYLHVKRLNTDRPTRRRLSISSRLRYLERIARPYIVKVRWSDELADDRMQQFVKSASAFIQRARVGDEQIVRDADGVELGGVRIVAPWEGSHVNLTIGLPTGFIDNAPRIRKLLRKAHRQFMPKATNVFMMCTPHEEDMADFETALLGSHIERWDAFPPRGRRIAHGRDNDGFWRGRQYADSTAAAWSWYGPDDDRLACKLWLRGEASMPADLVAVLRRVFDDGEGKADSRQHTAHSAEGE